ncbi:MAG: DUF6465 family protein [Coprococcus sp.]
MLQQKDWTKQGNIKFPRSKSIELYVKPEDYAVYYVDQWRTYRKSMVIR